MNLENFSTMEKYAAIRVAGNLSKLSRKFEGFEISHFDFEFEKDRGAFSRGEDCEMVVNPSFEVDGLVFSYDESGDGSERSESIEDKKLSVLEEMESDLWNEKLGIDTLRSILPKGELSVKEIDSFLSSNSYSS